MLNASLKQLAAQLLEKKISSVELTEVFLKHIKTLNPELNAFITINEEMSFAQAQVADKMIASGQTHPLTGIPVAQKDIFCAKGWLTTCGSKMLSNFISPMMTSHCLNASVKSLAIKRRSFCACR